MNYSGPWGYVLSNPCTQHYLYDCNKNVIANVPTNVDDNFENIRLMSKAPEMFNLLLKIEEGYVDSILLEKIQKLINNI